MDRRPSGAAAASAAGSVAQTLLVCATATRAPNSRGGWLSLFSARVPESGHPSTEPALACGSDPKSLQAIVGHHRLMPQEDHDREVGQSDGDPLGSGQRVEVALFLMHDRVVD